ncbi:hypothetical protein BC827DRAFT_1270751 [Russula dissimulans]|nr:hypothetical protein BC827DRAFT_1270751 [Russula dissimulans]
MTTSYHTQDVELGASQSTTTVPPPIHVGHRRIESQVVIVSVPAAAEPSSGNTNADPDDPAEDDEDAPPPLGVKLTVYRLLNIVVVFTIGVAKFILSLKGQSISPSGLEWAAGPVSRAYHDPCKVVLDWFVRDSGAA